MATEREITEPVDLCDGRGRLNPDARGWSRQPVLRANLVGRHGRKKRWDYWNVNTDEWSCRSSMPTSTTPASPTCG